MVILLDQEIGKYRTQVNSIKELKSLIGENCVIYKVVDKNGNTIPDLDNWFGEKKPFNFKKLELL